ncbi:MAG: hypothetical protein AAGF92_24575 [Myxococcota bacterium]
MRRCLSALLFVAACGGPPTSGGYQRPNEDPLAPLGDAQDPHPETAGSHTPIDPAAPAEEEEEDRSNGASWNDDAF